MIVIKKLTKYGTCVDTLLKAQLELEGHRHSIDSTSGAFDDMAQFKGKGGKKGSFSEKYIERLIYLTEKVERLKYTVMEERIKLEKLLSNVNSEVHRMILQDRYLELLEWKDIFNKWYNFQDWEILKFHKEAIAMMYTEGKTQRFDIRSSFNNMESSVNG
ncbi:MAG: hypothetical protein SOR72_04315 [Hornefia sp.]|nr:hypothetical protein [Hornefia sp.]